MAATYARASIGSCACRATIHRRLSGGESAQPRAELALVIVANPQTNTLRRSSTRFEMIDDFRQKGAAGWRRRRERQVAAVADQSLCCLSDLIVLAACWVVSSSSRR